MSELHSSRRDVMRAPLIPNKTPAKRRPKGQAWPAYDLLPRINRVLTDRGMLASRFGRRAVNDPGLVEGIEAGRRLRRATRDKVEAYLRRLEWLASIKGEA